MSLKKKSVTFYLSLAIVFLNLIGGILYTVFYVGTNEFDWKILMMIGILVVVTGVLLFFKESFVPYLQFLCTLVLLCFFIYAMYYYVTVVYTGIDTDHFSASFILCSILFGLSWIASIVNVFLKPSKKQKEEIEA